MIGSRVLASALLLWGAGAVSGAELWSRDLDRSRGPYRGRVIDADTRQPIAGAVVVARWTRLRVFPAHSMTVPHALRETLTGADGGWVIEARDLESGGPLKKLHRPTFVIFVPGYGAYPWKQVAPTGFLGGIFEGAGATVELRRLQDREERLEQRDHLSPVGWTAAPFRDLPNFMRLLNEEHRQLGLPPYRP